MGSTRTPEPPQIPPSPSYPRGRIPAHVVDSGFLVAVAMPTAFTLSAAGTTT